MTIHVPEAQENLAGTLGNAEASRLASTCSITSLLALKNTSVAQADFIATAGDATMGRSMKSETVRIMRRLTYC